MASSPHAPSPSIEKVEGEALGQVEVPSLEKGAQPARPARQRDPRVWRPWLIFAGPLPVLIFCWVFFAVTWTRKVPVPDYLAPTIQKHGQSTTMVVSIVATILASYTIYFFSSAVRYVTAIHLAMDYTSLHVLTSATRIASKSLWLNDPRMKWTWIVGLSWVAVSLQTSSLTSFLDIREIQVSTGVTGQDLDMDDPQLLQVAASNPRFLDQYDEASSFFLQSIMINALELKRNITGTFNFNGYTYTSLTGGIRPSSFVNIENTNLAAGRGASVVPLNLNDIRGNRHIALPFDKTMSLQQQGLTADVSCRLNDPQDLSRYPGQLIASTIPGPNITLAVLSVTCPDGGTTSSIQPIALLNLPGSAGNIGALFAVRCPIVNTTRHDVIIRAVGPYGVLNQTVCTVAPKVTTVNVVYSYSGENVEVPNAISVSEPITKSDVPIWGSMGLDMLLFNVVLGQSTIGSTIGNAWLLTAGSNNRNITLTDAMAIYIQAAVEFSGTVIRYLYTQSDSPYIPGGWNGLAPSMRESISGTFLATTYGWSQDRTVSPLFLLPTTLVILATYGLLIYGVILARTHRNDFLEEDADFDPTDIVHVIAAHTPQTRTAEFKRFSDRAVGYTRKTSVRMRTDDQLAVRGFHVREDSRRAMPQPTAQDSMRGSTSPVG